MIKLWTHNLTTGLDWQDEQHKELFDRIDKLINAMTKGEGTNEILLLISFLDSYVISHFGEEEKEMARLNYPGKDSHLEEHKYCIEEIKKLKERVNNKIDTKLLIDTQKIIINWIRSHISKTDKALAIFILNENEPNIISN